MAAHPLYGYKRWIKKGLTVKVSVVNDHTLLKTDHSFIQ